PIASSNSRYITHLESCPSRHLPTNFSDEPVCEYGHTGAQTQIDINRTSSWLLTPGGGQFVMKRGTATVDNITLSVYQGNSAAGVLLASVTLTTTQFCLSDPNCGQFSMHHVYFPVPVELSVGFQYYVALTSNAQDKQSTAYFIKNNVFQMSGANEVPIVPSPVCFGTDCVIPPPPPPPPVPEPSTFALAGTAMAGLAWARRRRGQR
ncbi:MAG: PEP-CTERM sorting domain-containing protein, partial [Acidobacteria bacterium]|nr:PEP-CTERM sorting domain-containing protein [Acidobacteriota bacterium]